MERSRWICNIDNAERKAMASGFELSEMGTGGGISRVGMEGSGVSGEYGGGVGDRFDSCSSLAGGAPSGGLLKEDMDRKSARVVMIVGK